MGNEQSRRRGIRLRVLHRSWTCKGNGRHLHITKRAGQRGVAEQRERIEFGNCSTRARVLAAMTYRGEPMATLLSHRWKERRLVSLRGPEEPRRIGGMGREAPSTRSLLPPKIAHAARAHRKQLANARRGGVERSCCSCLRRTRAFSRGLRLPQGEALVQSVDAEVPGRFTVASTLFLSARCTWRNRPTRLRPRPSPLAPRPTPYIQHLLRTGR